jgi:hypothetical protein
MTRKPGSYNGRDLGKCRELRRLDVRDQVLAVAKPHQKVGNVPPDRRSVTTAQPHRLTGHPRHVLVEVGQQLPIQFKATLVTDVATRRRGPEQARVVTLTRIRPRPTDRPRSTDSTSTSRIDVVTGSMSAPTYRTSVSRRPATFTAQILKSSTRFRHEIRNPTRRRHEIRNPTRNLGSYSCCRNPSDVSSGAQQI